MTNRRRRYGPALHEAAFGIKDFNRGDGVLFRERLKIGGRQGFLSIELVHVNGGLNKVFPADSSRL